MGKRRNSVAIVAYLLVLGWAGSPATAAGPEGASASIDEGVGILDTSVVQIPEPQTLQVLSRSGHPRLYLSKERIDVIKRQLRSDAEFRSWYEDLREMGAGMLQREPLDYEIRDGLRLLHVASRVRDLVHTLGLLYHIEGDRRYVDRIWQEMQTAAQFPDWNPRHFLDTAEMTQAFAVAYDWLYHVWTAEQRRVLRRALVEKGLDAALSAYEQGARWTRMEHIYNWGQVTNSGIALGALAVLEDEPELASRLLHEALRRLPASMSHYAPDGGWMEGVHYWDFASRYTTYALDALGHTYGTDFGLSDLPGFSRTGLFPIYMTGPSQTSFNHSDSWLRDAGGPQLFWMAGRFGCAPCARHQKKHLSRHPINLIWYTPDVAALAAEDWRLPLDHHFEASHVALFRSSWHDPDALFVGFKGGDTDASHAHLDIGSFLLEADGVRWAIELGREDYNVPGYFMMDTDRWLYYRTRAEGQNTLVIGATETPDQSIEAVSRIARFASSPEHAFAVADLTPAYADHVSKAERGMAVLDGRTKVLVQDEVVSDDPFDAWWFMHTRAEVHLSRDSTAAVLRQDGKRVWAKVIAPSSVRFGVMEASPLPGSPNPVEQSENKGVHKLAVRIQERSRLRLAVLFVPLAEGEEPPEELPQVRPLADW